jgi:hypothetical protein
MLMRSERDDDAIDAAIAAAAQALTSAEPTAALRAGVRDRIGRRRTAWRLVPVATAAAVIVGALILGRSTSPAPGASVDQPRPSAPARVAVPPPELENQRVVQTVASPPRRLLAALEPPIEEVESLIPPITIPPLETAQIVVDASSGVMPIEIEPLRIEPLQGE